MAARFPAPLSLVALLLLGAELPADPEERVWIELAAPVERQVERLPVAITEVRGTTGAGTPHYHDVAIAIDLSTSTRLPSGVDVDEDGHVGASSAEIREDYWGSAAPEQLCDDLDDTIAAAELRAARRLLRFLDLRLTRVALIAFGDRAVVEAPAGSPREALEAALDRLDARHGWYGATDYASAVDAAVRALRDAPDGPRQRRRSVLFLTDGYPTLPAPEPVPIRAAAAAAGRAAAAEMRLVIFALGPEALRGREILRHMGSVSGGRVTELERPGDVLFHLPVVDLSDVVEVRIQNATTEQPGRAVRLFPDGSFDGFVPLALGTNRIRVTARGAKGGRQVEERSVLYDPVADPTREVDIEVERLRELLRDRTLEVEIVTEMKRRREERARELRLRVDPERTRP